MKQAGPCLFCSARCLFNLFTQANGVPVFEDSLCLLILFLSFLFIFVVIGVMAIWVGIMLYSFAMLSRYDNKLFGTLKNALIICMHHLPQTIIMLIATVGLIYFSCIYFTAFIVTIPLILYVDSYIFSSIFKKLEKDMVKKDEPEVIENEESEDLIEDTTDNKEE